MRALPRYCSVKSPLDLDAQADPLILGPGQRLGKGGDALAGELGGEANARVQRLDLRQSHLVNAPNAGGVAIYGWCRG